MSTPDLRLSVLGSLHDVWSAHPGAARSIGQLWSPFVSPSGGAAQVSPVEYRMSRGRLVVDGQTIVSHAPAPLVLGHFAAAINARALDGYPGLAVHAGVVARDRLAIAFPASSGAGKSTLTAAACAAGYDYVSDEALCVRFEDRVVEPYPKPLALSPWSATTLGLRVWDDGPAIAERLYAADQVARAIATGPLRLAHVVLPVRGHERATLTELDRRGAVQEILGRSFNHFRRPAESLRLVATLASSLRLWRLTYGSPADAAALIANRLA